LGVNVGMRFGDSHPSTEKRGVEGWGTQHLVQLEAVGDLIR